MIAPRLLRRPLLAGAVLLGTAVVVLGAVTPGYSHGADTISRLASPGQPHAAAGRAALVAYGFLVVAGAGALARHAPARARLLVAVVLTYGWAGVVAGLAARSLPGTAPTIASAVHVVATLVGGGAVVLAMAVVWRSGPKIRLRQTAGVLAWTVPLVAVVFERSWGSGVYGYAERLLVAIPVVWLVVLERSCTDPRSKVFRDHFRREGRVRGTKASRSSQRPAVVRP